MGQLSGPLTSGKDLVQRKVLIKREQNLCSSSKNFEISRQQSNLKMNTRRLPVFIQKKKKKKKLVPVAEKLVEEAHIQTNHGGAKLAIAKIR